MVDERLGYGVGGERQKVFGIESREKGE